MKKLIGLVVIVAALVLGSFYGMGIVTERTLKKNVDVINESNGLFVDIEHYHRGWFSSHTLLNWRLHVPERLVKNENGQSTTVPAEDYTLQMPVSVYHGPIIFTGSHIKFGLGYAQSDLVLPATYAEKFATMFTTDSVIPKLNLSVFVNYMNRSRLSIDLPSFKLIAKQNGNQFEWQGMESDISVSSNLKKIDGGITINGVLFTKSNMKATLGKVSSDYRLKLNDIGLYTGEANASMPSLVVTENQVNVLEVKDFNIYSSSDIERGLFTSLFKTSLDKMVAHGKTYGPSVLEMSIKNLDAQVLAQINAESNKLQQGPSNQRQQALLSLLPQLPKLLGQGAEFEVSKLSFVMPEGKIQGNLKIALPKGETGNPFQLVQKIQGHATLKIPSSVLRDVMIASAKQKLLSQSSLQQAMVQQMQSNNAPEQYNATTPAQPLTNAEIEQQAATQVDQKLSALVQAGTLTVEGSDYVVVADLSQGQLTINDKPFNPGMLQF